MPPYAINVFYTLKPLTERNGGPEFAPGSHQWGEQYGDEPCFRDQVRPTAAEDSGRLTDCWRLRSISSGPLAVLRS